MLPETESTETEETPEIPAEEAEPKAKEGEEPEVAEEGEAPEKEEGEGEKEAESEKAADGEPDADGEKAKAEEGQKHKRAGGWQRKIDRLERQNQILLEQLAGGRPAAAAAPPGKEQTAEEKAAKYVDDLVEQKIAARETKAREAKVQTDFQRRYAEAQAAHADFDEVVQSVDVPVSQALQQALLTSEHGPRIMYQLAKSPAELARISALPPLDAAREIGRLEAKQPSSTAPVKPKSATRPPAPPTSVGGSGGSSTRSLDDLPLAEYKRAYRSGRR